MIEMTAVLSSLKQAKLEICPRMEVAITIILKAGRCLGALPCDGNFMKANARHKRDEGASFENVKNCGRSFGAGCTTGLVELLV